MSSVPCGEHCSLCCMHDKTILTEDEICMDRYASHVEGGVAVLDRKENGHCVYLQEDLRCGIYDERPLRCQHFDCREWEKSTIALLQIAYAVANPHVVKIFARGRELSKET